MNFALIGAAGYVAPRHMKAIKAVGGTLIAAYDPHDSVGVLDQYFPCCQFFTEFERFDRHLSKHAGAIDYVAICSPNYLHDAHCRFAMRIGADAICEKPLVVRPRNLDELEAVEKQTGKRVWTILQSRLHRSFRAFNQAYRSTRDEIDFVNVRYMTPRGSWYQYSWKGNVEKSGGILFNIGIHIFDLLRVMFGELVDIYNVHVSEDRASGQFRLKKADIRFYLSTMQGPRMRKIEIESADGAGLDLSKGFEDLHDESYRAIIHGQGFGIDEARKGIELCSSLAQWDSPLLRMGLR